MRTLLITLAAVLVACCPVPEPEPDQDPGACIAPDVPATCALDTDCGTGHARGCSVAACQDGACVLTAAALDGTPCPDDPDAGWCSAGSCCPEPPPVVGAK